MSLTPWLAFVYVSFPLSLFFKAVSLTSKLTWPFVSLYVRFHSPHFFMGCVLLPVCCLTFQLACTYLRLWVWPQSNLYLREPWATSMPSRERAGAHSLLALLLCLCPAWCSSSTHGDSKCSWQTTCPNWHNLINVRRYAHGNYLGCCVSKTQNFKFNCKM
jgi:hypothetical protein